MKGQIETSLSCEVAAITGYMKQYEYSASIFFLHMQDGIFEAISISEPSA
jgi:hypothetical protein